MESAQIKDLLNLINKNSRLKKDILLLNQKNDKVKTKKALQVLIKSDLNPLLQENNIKISPEKLISFVEEKTTMLNFEDLKKVSGGNTRTFFPEFFSTLIILGDLQKNSLYNYYSKLNSFSKSPDLNTEKDLNVIRSKVKSWLLEKLPPKKNNFYLVENFADNLICSELKQQKKEVYICFSKNILKDANFVVPSYKHLLKNNSDFPPATQIKTLVKKWVETIK